jgi:5'-nucleotidase
MRILVTNDDGIHAEGLSVLEQVARSLSDDVWVVAPDAEQSGAAHSLTLRLPLRVSKLGEKRFAVHGTPTDCVLVGISALLDGRPDLILSGVNYGANLADDVTYSGTVAAAMEGALLGIPSIAFSQTLDKHNGTNWKFVHSHAAQLIQKILAEGIGNKILININFPSSAHAQCQGVKVVRHGSPKLGDNVHAMHDPEGRAVYWIGRKQVESPLMEDTDDAAVEKGYISVTPVHLDLTHYPSLERYKQHLEVVE